MESTQTPPISKGRLWTARILGGLAVLFLLFDVVSHFMIPQPVVDSFKQLGIPIGLSVTIAIILLVCVILYVIPRTSIFGAILLTGYLGGAVAVMMRIGTSLGATLFPVYTAFLVWGAIYLTNERLRALIPFQKQS